MSYYTGDYYQGDNYGAYQAGGLFKTLGKIAGGVVRSVARNIPGVGGVVDALLPTSPRIQGLAPGRIVPVPGIGGGISRALPGGESGYMLAHRRRVNPLNLKALRRAGGRVRGFLRIARRMGALPVNRGKGKKLYRFPARKKR